MNVQVIMRDGEAGYAVLAWADYQALLRAAGREVPAAPGAEPVGNGRPILARLGELREGKGFTQEQLARAVGISPHYLAMIEKGERQPDAAIGSVAVSARPRRSLFLREARRETRSLVVPNEPSSNDASRKNRPVPSGCAANGAMRRCGTWQGGYHSLRPAPNLAPFGAATRFATKRQQTLARNLGVDGWGDEM
ncbi:hypothetical protein PSEWESI4_02030 [Pseudomonas carbonaria]|uniref:HTH cro/C1-type domain-containing protein n=1 Tax=Zestomonas carbonaria TaxID=2762745 RepID=A0A7U7EMH7_9GAMM|nr:hypothetical protein PSEWESI4_02030 [Pseudomonas carbonaria]